MKQRKVNIIKFQAGGCQALFRGAKMLLLRSIPVNAVTFIGFVSFLCFKMIQYFILL